MARQRTKIEREQMLHRVAHFYVRGATQHKIAETLTKEFKVEVSRAMVKRDLDKLRELWKESAVRDFDEATAEQLRKLDEVEFNAWEQWEKSIGPTKKTKVQTNETAEATYKSKSTETIEKCGDPRYLQVILSVIERRSKLLGLDAPTKISPTTPDGEEATGIVVVPAVAGSIDEWLQQFATPTQQP